MTDELKRRLARLREIARRLNAATDQASRLVAQVGRFLVEELHIGISAEVFYEELPAGTDDDNRALWIRHSLAFGAVVDPFAFTWSGKRLPWRTEPPLEPLSHKSDCSGLHVLER